MCLYYTSRRFEWKTILKNWLVLFSWSKIVNWIDRRCKQRTDRFPLPFGEISVILVGDIAQVRFIYSGFLYISNSIKLSYYLKMKDIKTKLASRQGFDYYSWICKKIIQLKEAEILRSREE